MSTKTYITTGHQCWRIHHCQYRIPTAVENDETLISLHTFGNPEFSLFPDSAVQAHKKTNSRYDHTERGHEPRETILVRRVVEIRRYARRRLHSRRIEQSLEFCG